MRTIQIKIPFANLHYEILPDHRRFSSSFLLFCIQLPGKCTRKKLVYIGFKKLHTFSKHKKHKKDTYEILKNSFLVEIMSRCVERKPAVLEARIISDVRLIHKELQQERINLVTLIFTKSLLQYVQRLTAINSISETVT